MSPPWPRAIERAIASPRPMPPVSCEREPSSRTNGLEDTLEHVRWDARAVVLDDDFDRLLVATPG